MEERQQAEGDHKFKNCDNNIQSRTHFFSLTVGDYIPV